MINYYNWQEQINEDELNNVIDILKNDGVVIFPTDTVYGIGCNALSKKGIDKVYNAKHRPKDKAVNILVKNKEEISKYAKVNNDIEQKIIDKYMPGAITIILEKKDNFGEYFTSNNKDIGIRIPNNQIILKILERLDFPLIAPSANISGKESGINPTDIQKDFENTADVIIDGGVINNGIASTIVRVDNNQINILRQGDLIIKQID